MKFGKFRVELVHWVDSNANTRWDSRDEYKRLSELPMDCRSVGFVVNETPDRISLLLNESCGDSVDMQMTIPKCAIKSRTVLMREKDVVERAQKAMKRSDKGK